jgi:hypothetical protein
VKFADEELKLVILEAIQILLLIENSRSISSPKKLKERKGKSAPNASKPFPNKHKKLPREFFI